MYKATDFLHSKEVVAKIEPARIIPSVLRHEFVVLSQLAGIEEFPQPVWFGEEAGRKVLILNRLGSTLEQAFNACNRVFALYTIGDVVEQPVCVFVLI